MPARVPDCHSDRPHEAKGLCKTCYQQKYRTNGPDKTGSASPRKGMKLAKCKVCSSWIPKNKNGRYSTCGKPECKAAHAKDKYLQRTYGITLSDWQRMFDEQGGRCALCRRKSQLGLAVEHSHLTGTVRGLCCVTCNRDILGFLDKDPAYLREAIAFLQRVLADREATR